MYVVSKADLPGWPLFSPPKVQLQKCTKCSREFCSSINFRRHTCVHRRSFKIDKDFPKNRNQVGAFWDKLTVDQAKEILSLEDMIIEGVSGSSILIAFSTWMFKPGFTSLPLPYAKAGSALLDIVEAKAARLPVSSNELFNMLDEASEKTFLCTNTVACIQKFLFDGEAEKVAMELKNVVACTSYMLEQKLVGSWCDDKAAEALRCQKLLVEEEEAAQKRQAELIERKRMKKLRQKEQKLKGLKDEDLKVKSPEIVDDAIDSPGSQSPKATSDPGLFTQEDTQHLIFPTQLTSEVYNDFNMDLSAEDACYDLRHELYRGFGLRAQAISRRQLAGPKNHTQNGFVLRAPIASECSALARDSHLKDSNVNMKKDGNKTWTKKVQPKIAEGCPREKFNIENGHRIAFSENSRVLIGSISVTVEGDDLKDFRYSKNSHYQKKLLKPASNLSIVNNSAVKLWRPVNHDITVHSITNNDSNIFDGKDNIPCCADIATPTEDGHSSSSVTTDENSSESCKNLEAALSCADLQYPSFSSKEVAAFLSQRWKEAIAADHVKVVVS